MRARGFVFAIMMMAGTAITWACAMTNNSITAPPTYIMGALITGFLGTGLFFNEMGIYEGRWQAKEEAKREKIRAIK